MRIEISKPSKRLENITAKNNKSVLSNKVATSHEERKLARFFEKLANQKGLRTHAGIALEFIMTEESSPGMAEFKNDIQGFPTYMAVYKENGNVLKMDELNVQSRTAGSIRAAAQAL